MKKFSILAAVVLAAIMGSCTNSAPKADMKNDVDTLSYSIGMAQSRGLKEYLTQRMGVDTTYIDEFIKGIVEGANAGENKKKAAYYAGLQMGQQIST
ncbi:MAG: FKBP-type peptidyl-prolyl cis-trans isomerase, partial [Bacteroidaceae bacterium]|nr:FKBP-type peptidyl-prolyl cis-trans isomerase [Bacteroidaceae bacterium]